MSDEDPLAFGEMAEAMAFRGQNSPTHELTTANVAVGLAPGSSGISRRLELIVSQCRTNSEVESEMWDDFEIHRRSADTYTYQYLQYLQRVHERGSRVHAINDGGDEAPSTDVAVREPVSYATGVTREQHRLKIARDSLARDLLAMHETLEFLKARVDSPQSRGPLPASALFVLTGMFGYVLFHNNHPRGALAVAVADVAGLVWYKSSSVWELLRTESITRCQGDIEGSLQSLNSRNVVTQERLLKSNRSRFWVLDYFKI